MIKFPKEHKEFEPGGLDRTSKIRRESILLELLEFVESVPLSPRIEERNHFMGTQLGQLVTSHSNTLVRYYDRVGEDMRDRISKACDVQSYEDIVNSCDLLT